MSRDIVLSSTQRRALSMIRELQRQFDQTEGRLTTGRKVNNIIDNPIAFFQAKGLSDRSEDFIQFKQQIDQGLSALESTLEGIEAIDRLLKQMKGIAGATQSQSTTERMSATQQFNQIGNQLSQLIEDTSYNGLNLLNEENNLLDVRFSDRDQSRLRVNGVDLNATMAGSDAQLFSAAAFKGNNFNNEFIGVQVLMSDLALGGFSAIGVNNSALFITNTVQENLDQAINRLRALAAELGANVAVLQTRSDFSESYQTTLATGSDKLTLADLNEEGANMVAVRTRQDIAISALAVSADQQSAILRLFR